MPADSLSTAPALAATLEDRSILVVEDDADIAELIALHLRDQYRRVVIANDGSDGFRLAKSEPWDLIILDLRLPGMDGLALCRQLRATENHIPILMLTPPLWNAAVQNSFLCCSSFVSPFWY